MTAVAGAVKLVNHRPARVFAVVVEAAQIEKHVVAQGLLRELADLRDARGISQLQRDFAAKLRGRGQQLAEFGFQLVGEFESGHE